MKSERGVALFADRPVKRDYVVLEESIVRDDGALGELISASVKYVVGSSRLDGTAGRG